MNTILGTKAIENLNRFKKHCLDEEFTLLKNGVIEFDRLMTQGDKFNQIQADVKLNKIKELNFNDFLAVMFVYFGKTIKELKNI